MLNKVKFVDEILQMAESSVHVNPEDGLMLVKPDGTVDWYLPVPPSRPSKIPANAILLMGLSNLLENPEFLKQVMDAGLAQARTVNTSGPIFAMTLDDGRGPAKTISLTGEHIKALTEMGVIYACDSPAHRGHFHFTDEFVSTKHEDDLEAAWVDFRKIVANMVN